jgi:DNA-binding response OmpR family regulator
MSVFPEASSHLPAKTGSRSPRAAASPSAKALHPLVYVVEDDLETAKLLGHHLEAAGYRVRMFSGPESVIAEAENEQPSLFVLNVQPGGGADGLELCRRIRLTLGLAGTPIIILSTHSNESERILGLDAGADDYITKSFSPRELLARIKAVQRRLGPSSEAEVISMGDVVIDSAAVSVSVGGRSAPLSMTEFRLLEFLARHAGRVFTRQRLLELVWGSSEEISQRAVDVYVRRIREKIEKDPEHPRYLRTIRGAGYRLDLPQ